MPPQCAVVGVDHFKGRVLDDRKWVMSFRVPGFEDSGLVGKGMPTVLK